MRIHNILIVGLFVSGLMACEKTVVLDLDDTENKVIIEGQVTDRAGYQFVKLSRSTGFYSTGKSPRISNATVQVEDNLGNLVDFVHNPNNHPDSAGYYLPETEFTGVINRAYTLTVTVDGQNYTAKDSLIRLVPIDQLTIRIDEDEQADPKKPGQFYQMLMYVTEPQDTRDYYMFKCYRNGKLEKAADSEVYYADDEFIQEQIDGIPMPVYFAEGDLASVEVFSLSREAFIFYRDLDKVLNNDGGMYDPPASNPRNNISNGALGFFMASAIQTSEITVE